MATVEQGCIISISRLNIQPVRPEVLFAVSFALCAVAATALVAYAPESFLALWRNITISTTSVLCHLFGIPVTTAGDIMTVNGFAMRIITQCTALHYIIIISAAILLYTRHTIQYRAMGLIASTLLIIAANALRLVVTGVVGSVSLRAFHVVHDYLWVAAFSLLILGIWIVWAEQKLIISGKSMRRCTITVASCTTVYGLLYLAMPLYGRLMATVASPLFKFLVGASQAGITFTGDNMQFSYLQGNFTANFSTDILVVALYLGLVISAGSYGKADITRGGIGLLIILCINVMAIAGGGAFAVVSGKEIAVVFLWVAHGLLLQMTLWWLLMKTAENDGN